MNALDTLRRFYQVLFAVQAVAPSAVLAGGALRDLIHHRPIKDLDIFVHEGTDPELVVRSLRNKFGRATRVVCVDFSSCEALTDCLRSDTIECGPAGGEQIEVNLITLVGTPTFAQVLARFDFGICQIGIAGPAEPRSTDAYIHDANNHTFTVTRNDNPEGLERTLRRWERLSEKYRDWRLVNPFA